MDWINRNIFTYNPSLNGSRGRFLSCVVEPPPFPAPQQLLKLHLSILRPRDPQQGSLPSYASDVSAIICKSPVWEGGSPFSSISSWRVVPLQTALRLKRSLSGTPDRSTSHAQKEHAIQSDMAARSCLGSARGDTERTSPRTAGMGSKSRLQAQQLLNDVALLR
jgi:hypothetical protein